ncbi:MAG: hypothetical protein ACK4GQ_04835 [Candidatus Hadarchaeales archaeon]
MGLKILIQGLGEVPAPAVYAIEKERPAVTYILSNEFLLDKIPPTKEYKRPNRETIERAAKKFKTKVVWEICDIFDVSSVAEAVGKILKQIKPRDEVVINYTGGPANVKLLLGICGVFLSKIMNVKLIYALRYKGGTEVYKVQTDELRAIWDELSKLV